MTYEKDLSMREIAKSVAFKIRTSKSFSNAKYARKTVRKVLDWLWDARDFGVLNEFYFDELYEMCIDALVEIDKKI